MKKPFSLSFFLWIFIFCFAAIITLQNVLLGENHFWGKLTYTFYNNFIIFRNSFSHLIHDQNLYTIYAGEYADLYKYSPTFAVFMAAFYFFPDWLGLFLWNFAGLFVLCFALKSFISEKKAFFIALVFILPELILTTQNSQSNALLAGLLLLAFQALEKQKKGLAAALIVSTIFIKLFTAVAFLLFLFYPGRLKSAFYVFIWTLVFACLPLICVSPASLIQQYQNWLLMLQSDESISTGLSVYGILEGFHLLAFNKDILLAFGLLLLLLPEIKFSKWKDGLYRQNYLFFIFLWIVLFNYKAESPSYIIVMVGCALWIYFNGLTKSRLTLVILCFVFSSLMYTDLCPKFFRDAVIRPYHVKAIFPTVIMVFMFSDLLSEKKKLKETAIDHIENDLS